MNETKTRQDLMRDALLGIRFEMLRDYDVREHADAITGSMRRLLDHCDLTADEQDEYTSQLVDKFILFSATRLRCEIGGSRSDYCSSAALRGLGDMSIRLRDDDEAKLILHEIRKGIWESAIDPRRMFWELSQAGVPIHRH